jgi:hypothetical protein
MGLKGFRFDLGFWGRLAGVTVVLCLVGLFFSMYLHVTYGDVLFVEGLLILGGGAFIASGVSNLWGARVLSTSITMKANPDAVREFLKEQRAKQVADGIWIMIVSAIIMVISAIILLV